MRFLLITMLLLSVSCAHKTKIRQEKPFRLKQPQEITEQCVERFLRLGVQPLDASNICMSIHK